MRLSKDFVVLTLSYILDGSLESSVDTHASMRLRVKLC